MALRIPAVLLALLALVACDARPNAPRDLPRAAASAAPAAAAAPLACATTREVDGADVVVVREERLYYLNGTTGLAVYDVSDAATPRLLGRAPLVGTPISLVVRQGVAVVVVADWEAPEGDFRGSIARAFDVRGGGPVAIGEARLRGTAREARAVDDVLYVLHSSGTDATLTSLGIAAGLTVRAERRFAGPRATMTASPTRLALAHRSAEGGTAVVTFDLGLEASGDLAPSHEASVRGSLPPGAREPGQAAALAIDEDTVHVLTCAGDCGPADPLWLSRVDLAAPRGASLTAETPLAAPDGALVARFDAHHAYIAGTHRADDRRRTTTLRIVDLDAPALPPRTLHVEGRISNLALYGDRVLALGALTEPRARLHVVLHEIDPSVPRVVGRVVLADTMTSTPAGRDVRAIAFDEATIAFPITSWDEVTRPANGVAVLRGGHPSSVRLDAPGWVDRVAFVGGRMIVLGEFGAGSIDPTAPARGGEHP